MPRFYEDEFDALNRMLAASSRETKELAAFLWPGMAPGSAYAKLKACLRGTEHFKFREIVAAMKFCGEYDPLFWICDEAGHTRPERKASEDQEAALVDAVNHAAAQIARAVSVIERLREVNPRKPATVTRIA